MATNFPTSLDALTNPTSSDPLSSPNHANQHADANDAIEALEAKVGINSSAITTSHDYKIAQLETNSISKTTINSKGDLLAGSANDTVSLLTVGSNNALLVADNTQTAGLKWATTLTGLTFTSPVVNTPTIATPTVTAADITGGTVDQLQEDWNIVASAATGTINFDLKTASIWYYTSNATANHTINVRGDSSTTLSSLMAVGDSVSVTWANTNGTTAYRVTAVQIDGSAVTPKWLGGSAPSAGSASAVDLYTFVIVKTASTPTYTVFASFAKFA